MGVRVCLCHWSTLNVVYLLLTFSFNAISSVVPDFTGLLAQVDKNKKVKEIEDFIKKVGLGPRKVS